MWHGDQHKRKDSGGKKRANRKKRRFEKGFFPVETTLGKPKSRILRKHGGNKKISLLAAKQANVSDSSGKTAKVEIVRVIENPTNIDYDRRGVITQGTIIATQLGNARVTSRPGQDGIVNAVLVPQKDKD